MFGGEDLATFFDYGWSSFVRCQGLGQGLGTRDEGRGTRDEGRGTRD